MEIMNYRLNKKREKQRSKKSSTEETTEIVVNMFVDKRLSLHEANQVLKRVEDKINRRTIIKEFQGRH